MMIGASAALRALPAAVAMVVLIGFVATGMARASEAHPYGINKFTDTIVGENQEPATQAGSHPYAITTTVEFATRAPEAGSIAAEAELEPVPSGLAKEIEVGLPTGVTVNPETTTEKCTETELDTAFECPNASAVGVADIQLAAAKGRSSGEVPVFNMVTPWGVPAELGFEIAGIVVHIVGSIRTGGDYGFSATTSDILGKADLYGVALTLWGEPSAESHDEERGNCLEQGEPSGRSCPVARTNASLLTLSSACTGEPLTATVGADSWEEPGKFLREEASSPSVTGCSQLPFNPTLSAQVAEPAEPGMPTGFEIDLAIPQEKSFTGYYSEDSAARLAESDLKEAVVALPAGMTVSPSAANGLGACPLLRGGEPAKEAEESKRELVGIDLESKQPANCPDESKLGVVEIVTPLLEAPLKGSVYLAQQGNLPGNGSNPFKSLLALYLVAEGSGAIIKLAGEVKLDPRTGQLSAKFGEDPMTGFYLPQLPFNELKLRFFNGPRAPLVAPSSCGTYTTTSQLAPWDGNPASEPSSGFSISSGCGARGFAPTLTAGTTNPQAGGFSDETVTIARGGGEQDLGGLAVTTPPGLVGLLSKVPLCGEPQAGEGTCGEASQIGQATVAVGPGADPYWLEGGRVYLTGPYSNEPFGLSIVLPTVAGPFTLRGNGGVGRETVRASIAVNPTTGALTIASSPLPTILEGVPLDIGTIDVDINRSEFTVNPTTCEELHVTSSLTSVDGATASPSSRFQVANCAALPFKPSLSATTRGNASDIGDGAALNVKIAQQTGEAAIRSIHLEIPKKLPARLHTLQQACREATFDANPANCPAASDVGTGIVHTPVLPVALEGPTYFVSRGGARYPELVFVLQGDGVTIDLAGETHIGSKTKITSSTFGGVPDAPIASFEANLPEGPDSALAGITPKGICGSKGLSMPTTIVGQNGARVKRATKIAIVGCPRKGHKKKG